MGLTKTALKWSTLLGICRVKKLNPLIIVRGDLEQLLKKYDIRSLSDGWHLDSEGEEFYFLQNPALGLWQAENLSG